MKATYFAASILATALLSACADSDPDKDTGVDPDGAGPGTVDGSGEATVQPRLKTFDNSDAFYTAVREALLNQSRDNGYVDEELDFAIEASAPDAVGADSLTDNAGDSAVAESATAPTGGGTADVTSTNVQEVGVDEQDRVKVNAAGTQLFVLSNEYSYSGFPNVAEPVPEFLIDEESTDGELIDEGTIDPAVSFAINEETEPAITLEEELSLASDVIEPGFIVGQTLTSLRILALDSETPDATSIVEFPVDLKNRNADGLYLYESEGQSSVIITASGGGYWDYWADSAAFSGRDAVIAKVDVTDAATASLTDTFTLDGQIISSRRIGDALFFVSRYYPTIPGVDPWSEDGQSWSDAVQAADLAALMPEYSKDGSDERTALVDASACFVAPGPDNQQYYAPDIITLGIIDLDTMELRDSECFLGSTETLYANSESVFLATTQYDYSSGPVLIDETDTDTEVAISEGEVAVSDTDIAWFDPRTSTDIHQFDIESDQLSYAGSGSVRGHLGWNHLQKPFRMSERQGYLRVVTMNDQQGPAHSPILLNILKADGQGNLITVSSLPNSQHPEKIGKPGEQLYASRFLGERAFLVTFRQTDPLYIVDLSDPENPRVTGELEIDGYSDYLQPVGANHLLGIGMNAVATDIRGDGDGRGGAVQGMKLSLFDITDPTAPTEVKSVLLGERGTNSVATYNHRAITIQHANDLHPMRVSFGVNVHGTAFPTSSPQPEQAFDYVNWSYTGLHGFNVTAGANADITSQGALVIARNNNTVGYYSGYGDDRSVMVNNAVFYVNGKNVYPALWDALDSEPEAR